MNSCTSWSSVVFEGQFLDFWTIIIFLSEFNKSWVFNEGLFGLNFYKFKVLIFLDVLKINFIENEGVKEFMKGALEPLGWRF